MKPLVVAGIVLSLIGHPCDGAWVHTKIWSRSRHGGVNGASATTRTNSYCLARIRWGTTTAPTCSTDRRSSTSRLDSSGMNDSGSLSSLYAASSSLETTTDPRTSSSTSENKTLLSHSDIIWKLRPEQDASWYRRLQWKMAGALIRLQCRIQNCAAPNLIFPESGQAVVYAYREDHPQERIGKFGILTQAGPMTMELLETVQDIYQRPDIQMVHASAIIYMFVEPSYRKRNVGTLALEVISYLHASRGCDYTVLVANDKGSSNDDNDAEENSSYQTTPHPQEQRLVRWYEQNGYNRAPKLQAIFGSPNGIYGVTMIAPTKCSIPKDCSVQWW